MTAQGGPAPPVDTATTAAANLLGALNTEPQSVHWLSDLKLERAGPNHNDLSFRPITLPGPLASAEFGFFDDDAVMRQLPRVQLIEMAQSDSGFRFVADLDHNGQSEDYRLGWFRSPGQAPKQFLAVQERYALRDVWTSDADELLRISWRHGHPVVFACNCPSNAPIVYAHGRLRMKMSD